jgi:hypothetical protein
MVNKGVLGAMVCRLGRSSPDLNCEAIFDPAKWKSVWITLQGKKLEEILREVRARKVTVMSRREGL